MTERVNLKNLGQFRHASDQLVGELKDALSDVCVNYIDADIYILDEFQRFKSWSHRMRTLIRLISLVESSANRNPRILLLSATPFKAYTGDSPWESGDEHYKEFHGILGFLFNGDKSALLAYEAHRKALFRQLIELAPTMNRSTRLIVTESSRYYGR